jgi:Flp pilus assembly pilin Flp
MTVSGGSTARRAEGAGRDAHNSDWMEYAVRAGLVAYAVVYLMIGWLAVQLALGDREGKPSSSGAMHQLAEQPFGDVLIWVVSIGMFLLVLWKLLDAAFGHGEERDDGKRTRKRLVSVGKAILYAAIGYSGLQVATGSGSGGKGQETWTAKVMNMTGGQFLVGLVALAIIAYGLYQGYQAWTEDFADKLDAEGRSGSTGTAYIAFGKAGYTSRGIAFVIVGGLFAYAAITHDASKSGGIDQALFEVLDTPFGPVLLCLLGVGLACYGLFTLARARHLSK